MFKTGDFLNSISCTLQRTIKYCCTAQQVLVMVQLEFCDSITLEYLVFQLLEVVLAVCKNIHGKICKCVFFVTS